MITRELLNAVDLFRGVPDEDLAALAALAKEVVLRKGEILFRDPDPSDRLYLVVSGVIETASAGKGAPCVTRLERGELLGELALAERVAWKSTATAAVVPETRLAAWDAAAFRAFLASHPRAGAAFFPTLLKKISARFLQASEAIRLLLRSR